MNPRVIVLGLTINRIFWFTLHPRVLWGVSRGN